MKTDHEWYLEQDLSKYEGQWVAIVDREVVISGKSVKKIMDNLKQKGVKKRPFIAKVPEAINIIG